MRIKGLYNMPGSKFLWYRWTEGGKRYAVSLKTDDMAEAVKKVGEIKAGRLAVVWEQQGIPAQTMATKVVDEYFAMAANRGKKPMRPRTVKVAKYVMLKFLRDNNITSTQEITYGKMKEWLDGLKKSGRAPDTLNRYGNILRPFAAYLEGKRLIGAGSLDVPERGATGRKNWLPWPVIKKVIADAKDPDLQFILYCGFHAGLRKSEILGARVFWFDLGADLIHVQNEPEAGFILKDRENRPVPLTDEFKEFLTTYLAGRDPMSYALKPEIENGKSDYRYDFKKVIASHFRKCGVTCTIHDMRRSFASNLVSRGMSIYKVAKYLGDGIVVVERSYGHLAPADKEIKSLLS
jgi:integrase